MAADSGAETGVRGKILVPDLRAARYSLRLRACETLHLPPLKGSTFRGAFGLTFKRLVCTQGMIPCAGCRLRDACPYPPVFESFPPPGAERLRNLQDVPRPFVIEPPSTTETEFPAGSRLDFGLVLIGKALDYLPHFVLAFREVGRYGIGRGRGRFDLERVAAETAAGEVAIYREGDEVIRPLTDPFAAGVWTRRAAEVAATLRHGRLRVRFATHVRLKERGEFVHDGPPFRALLRAVLARLSSLLYFHQGEELQVDFRGLLGEAEGVPLLAADTRWVDWDRYSSRQDAHMNLGGLIGRVTYGGQVEPFLPFLVVGEMVHVGKNATFGLGAYRIEGVPQP